MIYWQDAAYRLVILGASGVCAVVQILPSKRQSSQRQASLKAASGKQNNHCNRSKLVFFDTVTSCRFQNIIVMTFTNTKRFIPIQQHLCHFHVILQIMSRFDIVPSYNLLSNLKCRFAHLHVFLHLQRRHLESHVSCTKMLGGKKYTGKCNLHKTHNNSMQKYTMHNCTIEHMGLLKICFKAEVWFNECKLLY